MPTTNSMREAIKEMDVPEDDQGGDQLALLDEEGEAQFGCVPAGKPKAGRPPGARNITTEKTIAVLKATGRDPLLAMRDVVSMSPKQVREAFELKAVDAAKIWFQCAKTLAEYMHSKAPTRLANADGSPIAALNIDLSGLVAGPDREHLGADFAVKEDEEYQSLSDFVNDASSQESRHT